MRFLLLQHFETVLQFDDVFVLVNLVLAYGSVQLVDLDVILQVDSIVQLGLLDESLESSLITLAALHHQVFVVDKLNIDLLEFFSGFGQIFVVQPSTQFKVSGFTSLLDVRLLHNHL